MGLYGCASVSCVCVRATLTGLNEISGSVCVFGGLRLLGPDGVKERLRTREMSERGKKRQSI